MRVAGVPEAGFPTEMRSSAEHPKLSPGTRAPHAPDRISHGKIVERSLNYLQPDRLGRRASVFVVPPVPRLVDQEQVATDRGLLIPPRRLPTPAVIFTVISACFAIGLLRTKSRLPRVHEGDEVGLATHRD